MAERKRQATKRSIRRTAQKYELAVMRRLSGEHRGGVGREDGVVYANDGSVLVSIEAEQSQRISFRRQDEEKLAQALLHALRLPGMPPCAVVLGTLGRRPKMERVYMTLDDFAALVLRAAGKED